MRSFRPEEVNICGIVFKIEYLEDAANFIGGGEDQIVAAGECNINTQTIKIACKDKTESYIRQILWHEIIHGIVDLAHIEGLDETGVDMLSLHWSDLLTRNRWLVVDASATFSAGVGLDIGQVQIIPTQKDK